MLKFLKELPFIEKINYVLVLIVTFLFFFNCLKGKFDTSGQLIGSFILATVYKIKTNHFTRDYMEFKKRGKND